MAKEFDVYIEGLNPLLQDLRKLGKLANKELRSSSKTIAERHMVPAWKQAALKAGGGWGQVLADDIRAGSDRLPKVMIGKNKKVTRGGASSNMLRWPTDTGDKDGKKWGKDNTRVGSPAPFKKTNWIAKARAYQKPALQEWGQAVDRVVRKWPVI